MLKKMEIKDFDQVYTLMEESFPKDEYSFKIQSIRF